MTSMHDLVIRGGVLVDGTGEVRRRADVAIDGQKISAVGEVKAAGRQEFDATGSIVCPGFIDVHTHYDGQVTWENRLQPSSSHGVTTVVMGNCGVGFAPVRPNDQELVIKLLEGVEDIPDVVMTNGIPWNWETFPDYLAALGERETDIDFATQIPHSALRVYVMGERGANLEPPSSADLAAMRRLTREAIEAGAFGVTTSRSLAHRFRDGRFAPSIASEEDELLALAAGLKDAGAGVFQMVPNIDNPVEAEFGLMRKIVASSGRPLSFSLLQSPADDGYFSRMKDSIDSAWKEGLPIRGQYYPRPVGILMGLDLSYHPFSLNPSFRELANLPLSEKVVRMRDPRLRARLIAEAPEDSNPFFLSIVKRTDCIFCLGDPPEYSPDKEQSIGARARAQGIDPKELIYDALLENEGRSILYAPAILPRPAVANALASLNSTGCLLGLGDGGAHYGMICDAAYTTFVLTEWLRREGNVSLEHLVRNMTLDAARCVGFTDRGVIREGLKADLNVIDIDGLRLHAPQMVSDLPAGGRRLVQRSEGYKATIVSGQVTYRDGEATGALPGRLVRRGAA